MRIDWWTLGIQAANVLVLIWLLSRFLFRPVAQMIADRRGEISKLIEDARAAKAAAEAEREAARKTEAALAAERSARLDAATKEAETQRAAILSAAESEAKDRHAAAEAAIARAWESEKEASSDRASRLAVDIAAKLLDRLPAEARILGFLDGLAEGVAELPQVSRDALGTDDKLRLKVARPLTADEERACRERLAKVLGREVALEVETDPSLIAGLQIETEHVVVRNSFRADLDRITGALTHHGT